MANNMHKEEWINKVLSSTDDMHRANLRTDLFDNIMQGINRPEAVKTIPLAVKQWAAAAIILLALNIGSVVYVTGSKQQATHNSENNPIVAEMQSESTYNY